MATVETVTARGETLQYRKNWTETTRLMCASAYLEGKFAQEVLEEVAYERFRAIQVPPGIDVVPVVRHCAAARRQKNVRDALLAGLLLITVVATVATKSVAAIIFGFLVAWAIVLWDLWSATYNVAVRKLRANAFDPTDAPTISDQEVSEGLTELEMRQGGNLTVYSGFSPFSGAGFDQGGWSFAMDMRKGRGLAGDRLTPRPFEVAELYETVGAAIAGMSIDGATIESRLFVNGTDLRDDRSLLPQPVGRPVSGVADLEIAQFMTNPTHRVRHYTCVRVIDWRGELVVSLFLRFGLEDGRLFVELSRFLLPPLKPEYRRVDGLDPEVTLRSAATIARRALGLTLPLWLRSPSPMLRPVLRMRRQAQLERRVKTDPFFDYGAPVTALDRARSTNFSRYFQKLDREMHVKVLERGILDAIVEFLDVHNIDSGELTERRETIINNGIMVPGGSVQAHNVAVGQGAGIFNRLRNAAPASGGEPTGG